MPNVLTTLRHPPLDETVGREFGMTVDVLDRSRIGALRLMGRLVTNAPSHDAVVLDGSVGMGGWYADLLAAAILRHRRRRTPIVIADSTWKSGTWWLDRWACRLGIRLVDDQHVTYCVLSSDERHLFPRTWGIDAERVAFTPWAYTLTDAELREPRDDRAPAVFSGGDSMRDYSPLIAAARRLSVPVTIASSSVPRKASLPSNVSASPVQHDRFVALMRAASIVVVPLQLSAERSAGQQTYLNAMALGKSVIVTDCPGVRDYIVDGETGLIVPPGDCDAMHAALSWMLDPSNDEELRSMRRRARHIALERFSPQNYARSLFEVIRAARQRTEAERVP